MPLQPMGGYRCSLFKLTGQILYCKRGHYSFSGALSFFAVFLSLAISRLIDHNCQKPKPKATMPPKTISIQPRLSNTLGSNLLLP